MNLKALKLKRCTQVAYTLQESAPPTVYHLQQPFQSATHSHMSTSQRSVNSLSRLSNLEAICQAEAGWWVVCACGLGQGALVSAGASRRQAASLLDPARCLLLTMTVRW